MGQEEYNNWQLYQNYMIGNGNEQKPKGMGKDILVR